MGVYDYAPITTFENVRHAVFSKLNWCLLHFFKTDGKAIGVIHGDAFTFHIYQKSEIYLLLPTTKGFILLEN